MTIILGVVVVVVGGDRPGYAAGSRRLAHLRLGLDRFSRPLGQGQGHDITQ